ncbi:MULTISPECIES: Rossmann-like domain-containing protein [unclassified Streptosporangium]|uniref:Rossmann-like domain-containing protein n=1 Tax=unclassified Streptosporangium TaxID=2632669 RepID=UPI002E2D91EF|nr:MULTISPECIES: DUF364 domain-containing protein [unclassified Streptosporangium]
MKPSAGLGGLVADVLACRAGSDPARQRISVGFVTKQGAHHATRGRGYRNHVISLRLGEAVGSCAVEPDAIPDDVVYDCVGRDVATLLSHPLAAVRTAALDAYLMREHPHDPADAVAVPAGSSLDKSMARAAMVVDLLPVPAGGRVLVVGVVNSLLHRLRERGLRYVPCDLRGGETEWGEPHVTDAGAALEGCDAVLASGMTLGNGTFDPLLRHARDTGKPLVLFAQTGSAVLRRFVGAGVTALSAEPYPFFWLDGGPTLIYRYRSEGAR